MKGRKGVTACRPQNLWRSFAKGFIRHAVQLVQSCYIIKFMTRFIEPDIFYGYITEVLKGNSISQLFFLQWNWPYWTHVCNQMSWHYKEAVVQNLLKNLNASVKA